MICMMRTPSLAVPVDRSTLTPLGIEALTPTMGASTRRLRSAARLASSSDWKMLDPQLPKSQWYHTSAPWIGFRIVRQREIPSAEEMLRIWNNGVALDY